MLGRLSLIALLPVFMLAQPAAAVTAKQKMETCKVGAADQKLTGKKRDAFMKRCMGKGNYEPQARRDAMKATAKTKKTAKKKTTPKMKPAPKPAPAATAPPAPATSQPK
jgi:hypothetical protein